MKTKKRVIKKSSLSKKDNSIKQNTRLPAKHAKAMPPLPGVSASWEEQTAYFDKYGLVDLEEAGYLVPVNRKDKKLFAELRKTAKNHLDKRKREQLNLSLQPSQFDRLEALAKNRHLQPTTLARSWLLERLDQELPEHA